MSAWGESNWVGDFTAEIHNVFAASDAAWIDFSNERGRVGWRRILADTDEGKTNILAIATAAMQSGRRCQYRATNGSGPNGTAEITALQTV